MFSRRARVLKTIPFISKGAFENSFFFHRSTEEQSTVTITVHLTCHNREERVLREACVAKIIRHLMRGPSAPPNLSSRKDTAKARAAAQARMAPHLNLHACSARFFSTGGSDLTLAFAKKTKTFLSPQTTVPQSPRQEPPDGVGCEGLRALGTFTLSIAWQRPRQLHPHPPLWGVVNRHNAEVTLVLCPQQAAPCQRGAGRRRGSPSVAYLEGSVRPNQSLGALRSLPCLAAESR